MLVLSRKKKEKIVISRSIVVTVLDISNGKVRIGIDAPDDVIIHRKEVHEAVMREQKVIGHNRLTGDDPEEMP